MEKFDSEKEAMSGSSSRRFVKVAPPTMHAGIGEALRQAYRTGAEDRSLKKFEDLLARLD